LRAQGSNPRPSRAPREFWLLAWNSYHATFRPVSSPYLGSVPPAPIAACFALVPPFLLLDDDDIPLYAIGRFLWEKQGVSPHTFMDISSNCPRCPSVLRSYDVSLHRTRDMLHAHGMGPGLIFSSHMPQVIDQRPIRGGRFFDFRQYTYMISC